MADIPIQSLTFPGINNTYINNPVSVAPQFSTAQSYAVGDYVYYNRKLYCFTTSHPAGIWNNNHVTEVTVGGEISGLKGRVVNQSGTSVTIVGVPNTRYVCGEVLSLNIVPPENGIIDVVFTSGSTKTILTLPNTVKMPEWWTEIESGYIYEISIMDGIYGAVMSWQV